MWTDGYADKPSAMTDTGSDGLDLRITLKAFLWFQFGIVTLLVALGIFHYAYKAIFGVDIVVRISRIFDVNEELSIPTVFSTYNLLCSSILLFLLYLHSKNRAERDAFYWLILSIIFLGLSFDEGASFHERLIKFGYYLKKTWDVGDESVPLVGDEWVPFGALFSLAVFLFFIPFLRRLDRRTAALFVLSGAIFLAGALGFEYLGENVTRMFFAFNEARDISRTFEEGFEMYGIAIFNCTLFSRIVARNICVIMGNKSSTSATI
jgi:hypothetical protein